MGNTKKHYSKWQGVNNVWIVCRRKSKESYVYKGRSSKSARMRQLIGKKQTNDINYYDIEHLCLGKDLCPSQEGISVLKTHAFKMALFGMKGGGLLSLNTWQMSFFVQNVLTVCICLTLKVKSVMDSAVYYTFGVIVLFVHFSFHGKKKQQRCL